MKINTEKFMHKLFGEFKKIDEFRNHFKDDFLASFCSVLPATLGLKMTEELAEFVQMMAEETISFTEAVVEKDRSYPEYRKEEELQRMSDLLVRQNMVKDEAEKASKIKYEINALILKHYPSIYELSAFGYRLLDRNMQFLANQFLGGIRSQK